MTQVNPWDPEAQGSDPPFLTAPTALLEDEKYRKILEDDIIATAREQVTACRASGQRREALHDLIVEGNKAGGWGMPPEELEENQLLRDVDTRWSSIFLMVDRLMCLYIVSFKPFSLLIKS
jgi:hypothetical protein